MTADWICRFSPQAAGEHAELARPFPAWHQVLVELHEFLCRCQGFLLVAEFEDRVTANDFLGLDERAIDHTKLAALDAYLRAHGERHQPTIIEHAPGFYLPLVRVCASPPEVPASEVQSGPM